MGETVDQPARPAGGHAHPPALDNEATKRAHRRVGRSARPRPPAPAHHAGSAEGLHRRLPSPPPRSARTPSRRGSPPSPLCRRRCGCATSSTSLSLRRPDYAREELRPARADIDAGIPRITAALEWYWSTAVEPVWSRLRSCCWRISTAASRNCPTTASRRCSRACIPVCAPRPRAWRSCAAARRTTCPSRRRPAAGPERVRLAQHVGAQRPAVRADADLRTPRRRQALGSAAGRPRTARWPGCSARPGRRSSRSSTSR